MLVAIQGVNVTTSDGDKPYKIAEVSYTKDGKDEVRKVVSFGDSAEAFKSLIALKDFPANVEVALKKNGKFLNWTGIGPVSGEPKVAGNDTPRGGGRDFESKEERARRQVYIVRQSSITSALDLLKHNVDGAAAVSVDDVIRTARQFEAYVFEQPEPVVK